MAESEDLPQSNRRNPCGRIECSPTGPRYDRIGEVIMTEWKTSPLPNQRFFSGVSLWLNWRFS